MRSHTALERKVLRSGGRRRLVAQARRGQIALRALVCQLSANIRIACVPRGDIGQILGKVRRHERVFDYMNVHNLAPSPRWRWGGGGRRVCGVPAKLYLLSAFRGAQFSDRSATYLCRANMHELSLSLIWCAIRMAVDYRFRPRAGGRGPGVQKTWTISH